MDSEQTGKLLPYRQARRLRPRAFIYGFPIDDSGTLHCGQKIHPIRPDLEDEELEAAQFAQTEAVLNHLVDVCMDVWPPNRVEVDLGFTQRKHYTVLALAACTRPNDEFIPHGEDMKKLKEIMVSNGFKEEPRWFVLTSGS